MATLGGRVPTIADVTKTIGPNGAEAQIAYVLNETNAILDDIPWEAGNLLEGNRTSVNTAMPVVSARVANEGINATYGVFDQIDEACAVFESKSEMDRLVAETGGMARVPANRAIQARLHIQAMGEKMADTLFYGSASVPEEFVGIASRLNSLSGVAADNTIDCSGTGSDNTSIYGVKWSTDTVKGIYPLGTVGGLQRLDEGLTSIVTTAGLGTATLPGYREYFTWRCGLAVPDWASGLVRACNIDVSDLLANGAAATPLIDVMISMLEAIKNPDAGRFVFYMNRTARKMLRIQVKDAVSGGGGITFENFEGRRTMMFDGYPVRICDAITNSETAVA